MEEAKCCEVTLKDGGGAAEAASIIQPRKALHHRVLPGIARPETRGIKMQSCLLTVQLQPKPVPHCDSVSSIPGKWEYETQQASPPHGEVQPPAWPPLGPGLSGSGAPAQCWLKMTCVSLGCNVSGRPGRRRDCGVHVGDSQKLYPETRCYSSRTEQKPFAFCFQCWDWRPLRRSTEDCPLSKAPSFNWVLSMGVWAASCQKGGFISGRHLENFPAH